MVDRLTRTAASVKTVDTESGQTKFIVIPQSLLQQRNMRKTDIKISFAKNKDDLPRLPRFSEYARPRKRTRANLDHMSSEEKMMRRKLKNRVAAQNARDKKRTRLDKMEDALRKMQDKLRAAKEENERLEAVNMRLFEENLALKSNQCGTRHDLPQSPISLPSPSPSSFADQSHNQGIVVGRPSATADHTYNGLQQQDQGRPMAVDRTYATAAAKWDSGCMSNPISQVRLSGLCRLTPKKRSRQVWRQNS
jgi:hypothetical protein